MLRMYGSSLERIGLPFALRYLAINSVATPSQVPVCDQFFFRLFQRWTMIRSPRP